MIDPHGGKLVKRILSESEVAGYLAKAGELPKITLNIEQVKEVENIANGVFSPLEGFLGQADFSSVLDQMSLADGTPWTIPIILDVALDQVKVGTEVGLTDPDDELMAIMEVDDLYGFDKDHMAKAVYGTTDSAHPGVAKIQGLQAQLAGGKISLIKPTTTPYDADRFWPEQTRAHFAKQGWQTVVGFQTRNTPHNGHEYLQKAALTFVDGLFINPVIGKKKPGDYTDEVILATYKELIREYFPDHRVFLGILPMEMRYAGPREAIFHAIIRKNFGCTHFIVGRDHAGVGDYYAPFAAQEIFADFPDLGIQPMFFRAFFYCKKCLGVMNDKTCPHTGDDIINFAGTKIRNMIVDGQEPDKYLMRPEVAKVILATENPFC